VSTFSCNVSKFLILVNLSAFNSEYSVYSLLPVRVILIVSLPAPPSKLSSAPNCVSVTLTVSLAFEPFTISMFLPAVYVKACELVAKSAVNFAVVELMLPAFTVAVWVALPLPSYQVIVKSFPNLLIAVSPRIIFG